ncbi:MAG TPA: PAS domain S-box protein [Methanosarcina sp.]|nr:PAS domain S-box protein [Methanosarcina sp.]
MKVKMGQSPAINSNPVLSVEKDGTVLYSNEAGEPLLDEWGVGVGGKLPSNIAEIAQRVISRNNPEKMEVNVRQRVYLVVFYPLIEQECVNISGFDISDQKELEGKLRESEDLEIGKLEFADIIDTQVIQSLMNDFYKLVHIPIGLNDLEGNVLVGVGWQDICTKFHRIHPETCSHCVESNIKLSTGVLPGEFKMYRCKNNMWDVVTPITVGDEHVGYIFAGQFFFEDEPLDYELFRSQARQYGFNEEEYIAALEKVPRLSREAVDTGMSFLMTFANMVSQLGYSNLNLAKSLTERDILVDNLEKNKEDFDRAQAVGNIGSWRLNVCKNELAWSDEAYRIFGIPRGTHLTYETFLSKVHPDDREYVDKEWKAGLEGEPYDIEHRIIVDGKIKWVREKAYIEFDKDGAVIGGFGITQDITERKKAEEAIRLSNIYNRSLIEASLDPLVTIGRDGKITDVNGATEKVTGYSKNKLIGTDFSDYFTESEKARAGYQQVFMYGEVRDYPLEIRHKNGHINPVLYNASVYKDESGKVIGVFAAARDISDLKKAEKALKKAYSSLEEKVKERTAQLEEAYNSLLENERRLNEAQKIAHIGNWDWDIVNKEVYWSDELYRIGRTTPRKLGVSYNEFLSYVHPDDRSHVDYAIKEALNGKTFSIDHRIITADGEELTVHAQAEVIFDENNTPIRMRGIVQDITERKRAEEKIQILANAVESSNDAIVTLSLEGIVTSWNKAAEQVYGYLAEDILGKRVSILAPSHLRDETKKLTEMVIQGEKVHQHETLRLRKDGTLINVSITLSPVFDITGKLVAISGIVRDVTERIKAREALRESEARLRQFYESDMIGVYYFNLDGSITDANDKLLEIVGYTHEDLQAGKVNWNKMIPPEYRPLDGQIIAEMKTVGLKEPQEKEYIRKDGSHVPVIVGVATFDQVRNEGIAFVLDVTEKKKAEEALANIEVARKKEIHHRIKNNLQVISSLLDLQAEQFRGRKSIEDLELLEAFRESQDRVISMALIHEELYKGGEFETLNFSPYIQELAENLFETYSLGKANITLSMDLEENLFFDMDTAIPLGMIVNELVSNSLKHAFTGRDRGEIRIKLHREEESSELESENCKSINTSFTLTISDNGVGIPENLDIEDLDSLGMQLVTSLVDQLDGELELKNNNGTELTMRFTVTEKDNLAQVGLKSQENI